MDPTKVITKVLILNGLNRCSTREVMHTLHKLHTMFDLMQCLCRLDCYRQYYVEHNPDFREEPKRRIGEAHNVTCRLCSQRSALWMHTAK